MIAPPRFLNLLREEGLAMAFATGGLPESDAATSAEGQKEGPKAGTAAVASQTPPSASRASPVAGRERPAAQSPPAPASGPATAQAEFAVPPKAYAVARATVDADELRRLIAELGDKPGKHVDEVLTIIFQRPENLGRRSGDFGVDNPRAAALAVLRNRRARAGEKMDPEPLLAVIGREVHRMQGLASSVPAEFVKCVAARLFKECVEAFARTGPLSGQPTPDLVRRLKDLVWMVQTLHKRLGDIPVPVSVFLQRSGRGSQEPDLPLSPQLKTELQALLRSLCGQLEKHLREVRRRARNEGQ